MHFLTAWLAKPVDRGLYRQFVIFFSFKLLLEPFLGVGPSGELSLSPSDLLERISVPANLALLVALGIVVFSRAHYPFGLGICFAVKLVAVFRGMPYTGNHLILEAIFLGILLLYPAFRISSSENREEGDFVDGTACRLIMFSILTVFLYSGIQGSITATT